MKTFALLPLLLVGCDDNLKTCTLVDCMSGITITVIDSYGDPATNASGTITVDGTEYEFDCANPDASDFYCDQGVFFVPSEMVSEASYDVESADEGAVGTMELDFVEYMPNGEGCEPVCVNADYTIELSRPIE